jgi:hypothetical protein
MAQQEQQAQLDQLVLLVSMVQLEPLVLTEVLEPLV